MADLVISKIVKVTGGKFGNKKTSGNGALTVAEDIAKGDLIINVANRARKARITDGITNAERIVGIATNDALTARSHNAVAGEDLLLVGVRVFIGVDGKLYNADKHQGSHPPVVGNTLSAGHKGATIAYASGNSLCRFVGLGNNIEYSDLDKGTTYPTITLDTALPANTYYVMSKNKGRICPLSDYAGPHLVVVGWSWNGNLVFRPIVYS